MRKKLTASIIIFLISVPVYALEKPLIDPEQKKIAEKIEKEQKKCDEIKNFARRMDCNAEIFKKYVDSGELRGTVEYCEKNYTNKSFDELKELLKNYRAQQKTARYEPMASEGRVPGEIYKEDLQTDLLWIETRLARMQNAQTDEKEKGIKFMKKP